MPCSSVPTDIFFYTPPCNTYVLLANSIPHFAVSCSSWSLFCAPFSIAWVLFPRSSLCLKRISEGIWSYPSSCLLTRLTGKLMCWWMAVRANEWINKLSLQAVDQSLPPFFTSLVPPVYFLAALSLPEDWGWSYLYIYFQYFVVTSKLRLVPSLCVCQFLPPPMNGRRLDLENKIVAMRKFPHATSGSLLWG